MVHTDDLPNTPAKVLTSSRARNVSRATPRVAPKIEYRDPDTPSPSPSSGSDDGSVYQEANKSTPDVDDLKPVISEDEPDSPPSPSKRRKTSSGASHRASGYGSPKKVTPKKQGASGGGRARAWTAEEDWKLFQHLYPRVTPNWAEVARDIGRDAKVSTAGG